MAEKKSEAKAAKVNEYGQTQKEYDAAHSPLPKESKAEPPDTPSGLGLKAAEGKDGEKAAEAYHKAKKEARHG